MLPETLAAAISDRYHLQRELGQGGMAPVYLAQDARHDCLVAVKVLRPELEQAHAASSQSLVWLKVDRIYDPLRAEPRFIALMKKLNFIS